MAAGTLHTGLARRFLDLNAANDKKIVADHSLGHNCTLREQASVLRGNPEHVRELIDGCAFARAYTSGVLSFQEQDIADAEKSRLMDEWEHTLLTGLYRDQYTCLWVEQGSVWRSELFVH